MTRTGTTSLVLAAVAAAALYYVLPFGSRAPSVSSGPAAANGDGGGDPIVEVALPETLSANAQMGKTIFEGVCAACHGLNAAGKEDVAPPLVHKIYEPSHHADMAFVMAARNGVRAHHWRFGNMPPVEEKLTDAEIASIVRYIRELQRENGIF